MPGIAFFLSNFYSRHEIAYRLAIFIIGASLAGAFGGLLAAGLLQIPEWGTPSLRIHDWRNIFFVEGFMAIPIAAGLIYFMPNTPMDCRFLTENDRYIAIERIRREINGQHLEKIRLHHVYRAVFNINNTFYAIGLLCANLSATSVSVFMPTILKALGWTAIRTQLYTVPPYVVAFAYAILSSWLSNSF